MDERSREFRGRKKWELVKSRPLPPPTRPALPDSARRDYRERVIGILGRGRREQLLLRNGRFDGICRVERQCSSDYPHATRIPRGGTDIWPARGALRIICSYAAPLPRRPLDRRPIRDFQDPSEFVSETKV